MSGHYCEACGIFHGDYPGQCIALLSAPDGGTMDPAQKRGRVALTTDPRPTRSVGSVDESQNKTYSILVNASDVTSHIERLVADCVEDWFPPDSGALSEEDFIDRLCASYLNSEGFDIENFGAPAARKIMRHARRVRREMA